jgi:hypothetical protein
MWGRGWLGCRVLLLVGVSGGEVGDEVREEGEVLEEAAISHHDGAIVCSVGRSIRSTHGGELAG